MKTEIIAKVNKIGKAGLIITRIYQVCLWIGIVACILSGIVLSFIPDDMIAIHMEHKATVEVNMPEIAGTLTENGKSNTTWGDVESSLKVDGMEYGVVDVRQTEKGVEIEADTDAYTIHFRSIANTVFLAAVYGVVCLVVMHFVGVVCKKFKECDTPFSDDIVTALRNLAISLIPMTVFSTLTESVMNSIITGNVNIVLGVDLTTVLMILLIILLYMIFRYGTMLQQESDETL